MAVVDRSSQLDPDRKQDDDDSKNELITIRTKLSHGTGTTYYQDRFILIFSPAVLFPGCKEPRSAARFELCVVSHGSSDEAKGDCGSFLECQVRGNL